MSQKKFAGNQPGALDVVPLIGEEDEAGRGNPATLGSITAVFWLAPEGVMMKGAPIRGYG